MVRICFFNVGFAGSRGICEEKLLKCEAGVSLIFLQITIYTFIKAFCLIGFVN